MREIEKQTSLYLNQKISDALEKTNLAVLDDLMN